ncbi:DUF2889 domain-containing protein [Caballeronia novacaledonica]|uniref:DUF2889 domain-containing protein n=1 Tax=Caballeronia novacaledonica TaxID=1544861 RepID=A0AA37IE16_9BURK|nr:DUF2889 domain-containing protein [Caballeronia novacaledonica]GJH27024.1 DUF2889 domain-containing protein [Caballeronia novacaledonica]
MHYEMVHAENEVMKMPLPEPLPRRPIHRRVIDMNAYHREDGLYDIEARLVDTKPFDFPLISSPAPLPAGEPLHDLWIRLTVDDAYVVRDIDARSDATPYPLCKEAESTLRVLVGQRIASGWSSIVKERLRGPAGCTHLMEMLIPMATSALQAIRGVKREGAKNVNPADVPVRLDSCYAYSRGREVIQRFWPQHYLPNEAKPQD